MARLLQLAFATLVAFGASIPAAAEPVTCPLPSEIGVTAVPAAKDWTPESTLQYPDEALALAFDGARTDGSKSGCHYRAKGGGTLRIFRYESCKVAGGEWKEQGSIWRCDGKTPAQCVLECTKKQ